MKINKPLILSLMAPLMILISTLGLILRQTDKKIFYLPIGIMGVSIILEKDLSRKLNRKNLLKKIRSFQKVK